MSSPHYRFCPLCGGTLQKRSYSLYVCADCEYRFYQNSKPAAGALILRASQPHSPGPGGGSGEALREILLVKRNVEPYRGWWDIPGGFIHNGEDPAEALHREVREELGVEITGLQIFGAQPDTYPREGVPDEASNTLCIYYRCSLAEPEAEMNAQDDVSGFAWFLLDNLPDTIAFKGNQNILTELQKPTAG